MSIGDLKWQRDERAGGPLTRKKGPRNVKPKAGRSIRSRAAGGSVSVKAANENAEDNKGTQRYSKQGPSDRSVELYS